tara:strand:+ start:6613 stop:6777 length:165 start_codon:yes stop_codon:yes gene_type:complete
MKTKTIINDVVSTGSTTGIVPPPELGEGNGIHENKHVNTLRGFDRLNHRERTVA